MNKFFSKNEGTEMENFFKCGDLVVLKSGSPIMTVERLNGSPSKFKCIWFNTNESDVSRESFSQDELREPTPKETENNLLKWSKKEDSNNIRDKTIEICQGFPGAAVALASVQVEALNTDTDLLTILDRLLKEKVSPADIWTLYNDKCKQDAGKTLLNLQYWENSSDIPFGVFQFERCHPAYSKC
tara:strand:- start:441 stop:995 length:555 start_codon:yes stop_codon:yes gene_type:complete